MMVVMTYLKKYVQLKHRTDITCDIVTMTTMGTMMVMGMGTTTMISSITCRYSTGRSHCLPSERLQAHNISR